MFIQVLPRHQSISPDRAAPAPQLWETLIYDIEIKQRLLNYATSALLFAERAVNANIVSFNRVVLLHGPPGTGKTSLCKALAQKLSIRFSHRQGQHIRQRTASMQLL